MLSGPDLGLNPMEPNLKHLPEFIDGIRTIHIFQVMQLLHDRKIKISLPSIEEPSLEEIVDALMKVDSVKRT